MTILCPHCKVKNKFLSSDFCGEFVVCKACYQPILWEETAEDDNIHTTNVDEDRETSRSLHDRSIDRVEIGVYRK